MNHPFKHYVTAYFHFKALQNLPDIKTQIELKAQELGISGLFILAEEGFNSTCSSIDVEKLSEWKSWLKDYFQVPELVFKDSFSDRAPFRRFRLKIRPEIVTLKVEGVQAPPSGKNHHLNPQEWNEVLKNDKDALVIDTRNWYEYKIGTFKGAVNPQTEVFSQFPKFIEDKHIPKDKKILIFCTGGIRCEKGILDLQNQGYQNVYQLEGGILKYLEDCPNDQFIGECFVFDHRVALTQQLEPTQKYELCPHCGQPAEKVIQCKRCDTPMKVCDDCLKLEWKKDTCSKNCAYQLELHPLRKGKRQERAEVPMASSS